MIRLIFFMNNIFELIIRNYNNNLELDLLKRHATVMIKNEIFNDFSDTITWGIQYFYHYYYLNCI